jgi:hypothetical protein
VEISSAAIAAVRSAMLCVVEVVAAVVLGCRDGDEVACLLGDGALAIFDLTFGK